MRILITTGIYPPKIGGPAEYAKNLKDALIERGHKVSVSTYGFEQSLPTGLRHLFFFFKIIPQVFRSDFCIALDTFSVGLPSIIACRIFRKKVIVRIGGDFLWEQYSLRTEQKTPLPDFYENLPALALKEKIIYRAHKFILNRADCSVFSTEWQKSIWTKGYMAKRNNFQVIENCYYEKKQSAEPKNKNFLIAGRNISLKNIKAFSDSFAEASKSNPDIILDRESLPHSELLEKIKNSYAVAVPSISEISPNLALEALSFNKPFILTKYTGLYDRLKNVALFIDPLDEKDMEDKILKLADSNFYQEQVRNLKNFNFKHDYTDIAEEFLQIFVNLKQI